MTPYVTPTPTATTSPTRVRDYRCDFPMERGNGSKMIIMYYYDPTIEDCRPFRYSGAAGTPNRYIFRLTFWFLYARRQTACMMVWWCPSVIVYRTFFPTCFDILSWKFVYDSILRTTLNTKNFRHILQELCPFRISSYCKYAVLASSCFDIYSWILIHSFLFVPPTYFDILRWNFAFIFFYKPKIKCDCLRFASIFLGVISLLELRILEVHTFPHFLLHAPKYWADILYMTYFLWPTDQVWVSSYCINMCRSTILSELLILEMYSFRHFSPTCFDLLSWKWYMTLSL